MAFLVVLHMSPDHASSVPELLARVASVSVVEAENGLCLSPNTVYVAPPGQELHLYDRTLQLFDPQRESPLLMIDPLLRSIADDCEQFSAGVILSGTGSDGSKGVRRIKEREGLVLVQSRRSAKYAGMPTSALSTGVADLEVDVGRIPEVLRDHFSRSRQIPTAEVKENQEARERMLRKVFAVVRANTGHDFSGYKRNTLMRRIHRRMALQQERDYDSYIRLLRENRRETETLFREFLIGVTHFFRDAEAFEDLREKALAPLFDDLGQGATVRVWVPGCSTGEEAYSIAIILRELATERAEKALDIQIFATDIDSWAIQKARSGEFPLSVAADISEQRLRRFFVREGESYRVRKEIRETVIFSVQNILKDPPFSRLHLLSCRNMLIYLEREQQNRLLELFHYTLTDEGILMLGSSETIGGHSRLYAPIDQRWKIYRRKEVPEGTRGPIDFPTGSTKEGKDEDTPPAGRAPSRSDIGGLMQEVVLSEFGPTALLVDEEGQIIHVHGRTGKYLESTTGPLTYNIVDLAREGLKLELSTALRRARGEKATVERRSVEVKTNGDSALVDLFVKPLTKPAPLSGRYLVVLQESRQRKPVEGAEDAEIPETEKDRRARVAELEQELANTRESHQATVEQLESANEELRSTNEEMQSSNEELQSTNEELESSKEELQSLNEELNTVNEELKAKVDELAEANDDISNLLNSTEVASIFVDNELNIRRFSPQATEIVNLIDSDVGRPLNHVSSNLRDVDLTAAARSVVDTLKPIEREVKSNDDARFEMRVTPYRTSDNRIDGAVFTFFDIEPQKQAQDELERRNARLESARELARRVTDLNPLPLVVLDSDKRITMANYAFLEIAGKEAESIEGQRLFDLEWLEVDAPDLADRLDAAVSSGESFPEARARVRSAEGSSSYRVSGQVVPELAEGRYRILLRLEETGE
jgi:two-component system CheB/CheR fusion protein